VTLTLDHLAVGAETLADGVAWVEDRLSARMGQGGKHAYYGTHNRLLGLAPGLYLEVIAKDPDAPATGRPAWFGLDTLSGPPRLANWLCTTEDLETFAQITGPAVPLSRDGLTWETTVPDDGSLPMQAGFPSLLRWGPGVTPPSQSLLPSGCTLKRLTVRHPRAGWLRETLPLSTDLVTFETGKPALHADIETPTGLRTL